MKQKDEQMRLSYWQDKLSKNLARYQTEIARMDEREEIYNGRREITPITQNDKQRNGKKRKTSHVYNIVVENIEAEIDASIPMPKVTPRREEHELLAKMIENLLRNELDRLPSEEINDEAEHTVYKQGGVILLPEWDAAQRTHCTIGENTLQALHPKQFIPQDGVKDIDRMDYNFLLMPVTKGYVKRRYGVSVESESESMPELRGEEEANSEDMRTLVIVHYRNDDGGIGRFAYVGDTVCEDLEDCQSRVLKRCKKCGMTEADSLALDKPTTDGRFPDGASAKRSERHICSYCGASAWEERTEEERTIRLDELISEGVREDVAQRLQAMHGVGAVAMPGLEEPETQETAEVRIPYYKPNLYPAVLQKNVFAYGKFLGGSDIDLIVDQQNTLNRLSQKCLDRLIKAGAKIAMPDSTNVALTAEDNDTWRMPKEDLALVKSFQFTGDLSYEITYMNLVYEQSRRLLGITDSFQGRNDTTATSGKAKQFSAAQAAGRLESKRILKKAAWQRVFERMFKNTLAYCEEKRPINYRDKNGKTVYEEWNPMAFLDVDAAGELYWVDDFLFSCDDASGLAVNRQNMWQEMTSQLQSGALGNPGELSTLTLYWGKMDELHYPGAGTIKELLEERQKQQEMAAQQRTMLQAIQQGQMTPGQEGI